MTEAFIGTDIKRSAHKQLDDGREYRIQVHIEGHAIDFVKNGHELWDGIGHNPNQEENREEHWEAEEELVSILNDWFINDESNIGLVGLSLKTGGETNAFNLFNEFADTDLTRPILDYGLMCKERNRSRHHPFKWGQVGLYGTLTRGASHPGNDQNALFNNRWRGAAVMIACNI